MSDEWWWNVSVYESHFMKNIYPPIILLVKRGILLEMKKFIFFIRENEKKGGRKKLFFISCLQLKQWFYYHSFIFLPLVMLMMKFITLLWMNWARHQRHHNTPGKLVFNNKSSLSIRKRGKKISQLGLKNASSVYQFIILTKEKKYHL